MTLHTVTMSALIAAGVNLGIWVGLIAGVLSVPVGTLARRLTLWIWDRYENGRDFIWRPVKLHRDEFAD